MCGYNLVYITLYYYKACPSSNTNQRRDHLLQYHPTSMTTTWRITPRWWRGDTSPWTAPRWASPTLQWHGTRRMSLLRQTSAITCCSEDGDWGSQRPRRRTQAVTPASPPTSQDSLAGTSTCTSSVSHCLVTLWEIATCYPYTYKCI